MATKEIQIKRVNGSIEVTPKWKTLHMLDMDNVEWKVSPSNLNFVICFGKRTPFASRHYGKFGPNPGQTRIRSGKIIVSPPRRGRSRHYKYSIEAGNEVVDPGIIIQL